MRFHKGRKRLIEKYGLKFDNPDEVKRYEYLWLRFKAGEISQPEVHPSFPLIVNGIKVATYFADFRYFDHRLNRPVVEDIKPGYWKKMQSKKKGVVVREWKERAAFVEPLAALKMKWASVLYEIEITEVWE